MVGDEVGNQVKVGIAGVCTVHDPYENPNLGVRGQVRRCVAGILDGSIGDFQEEASLWIHDGGGLGGNMEEERIEAVDVIEKTAPFGIDESGLTLLLVKRMPVPTLRRNFSNTGAPILEILPKGMHVHGAGISSGEADDR